MKAPASKLKSRKPSKTAKTRKVDAAQINRTTSDWAISAFARDTKRLEVQDVTNSLTIVRNRARDLETNDATVRKFLSMMETNIIGGGVSIMGDDALISKFFSWADSADVTGAFSWPEFQRNVCRAVLRDGEAFILFVQGRDLSDALGLQLIDPSHFNEKRNDPTLGIYNGVKVDRYGKPTAYFFLGSDGTEKEIPAANLIHIFKKERPYQFRGLSAIAPVMLPLRHLHAYTEAELIASRVASAKMGFYKTLPSENFDGDGQDASGNLITDIAPGQFEKLPSGTEFQAVDFQHPTSQFGTFVSVIQRLIASGLGVSYNNLTGDLNGVSYSSIRSGTIEERELYATLQDFFIRAFLKKVVAKWAESAALVGTITLGEAEQTKTFSFIGRKWKWVDPVSDLQAAEKELALGLVSKSELAANLGRDFAKVQSQIAKDTDTERQNTAQIEAATAQVKTLNLELRTLREKTEEEKAALAKVEEEKAALAKAEKLKEEEDAKAAKLKEEEEQTPVAVVVEVVEPDLPETPAPENEEGETVEAEDVQEAAAPGPAVEEAAPVEEAAAAPVEAAPVEEAKPDEAAPVETVEGEEADADPAPVEGEVEEEPAAETPAAETPAAPVEGEAVTQDVAEDVEEEDEEEDDKPAA
jgi:lambda family phage portal protein